MNHLVLSNKIIQSKAKETSKNPAQLYLSTLMSINSRKKMKAVIDKVSRKLGYIDSNDCPWEKMEREHVQAIITNMSDTGKAPATINVTLSALKGIAEQAWATGLIDINKYEQIKRVKGPRGSRIPKGRALSHVELKNLLESILEDSSVIGVRDLAIISILIACGLRRSEIISLNYEDINFDNSTLTLIGKGNKQRICFLPETTQNRLLTWVEEVRGKERGPLFCRIRKHDSLTNERLTDQAVYYILKKRAANSGMKDFSPHDLRRTFVTMLIADGKDLLTVRDAAGHASVTTTERYNRAGDDRLKDASRLFNF